MGTIIAVVKATGMVKVKSYNFALMFIVRILVIDLNIVIVEIIMHDKVLFTKIILIKVIVVVWFLSQSK